MSLFARIVSHGFALAIVALLAIGLIYRGELFPDMELPAFLQVERLAKDSRETPVDPGSDAQPAQAAVELATGERDAVAAGESPDTTAAATDSMAETADSGGAAITRPAAPPADVPPPADIPPPQADVPPPADMPPPQADVPPPVTTSPGESGAAPAVKGEAAVTGGQVTRSSDAVVPPAVGTSGQAPVAAEAPAASTPATAAPVAAGQADEAVRADTDLTPGVQPSAVGGVAASAPAAVTGSAATQEPAAAPSAAVAQAESPYKLLAAAREAYWLRDYATAEQKYQAMIDLDPQNPDGYGELGNMYFSQGKWDRAAEVYFEAGKRLADEGLFTESRQIVDVLRGLQGPQADELEQYIAAKAGADQ